MIILAIAGSLCAGKKTAADYLQICYGFKVFNLESDEWLKEGNFSKEDFENEVAFREAVVKLAVKTAEEDVSMNYVMFPVTLNEEVAVLREVCNFMLIGVEAPTLKRYGFYNVKYVSRKSALASFLEIDDKVIKIQINFGLGGYPASVHEVMYSADKIVSNLSDKDSLYEELRGLDVMNPEHYRPSWDTYFMRIAEMAATRTNCMKRGVGAVIVLNNRLISAGYNGTPQGTLNCIDGGCLRCNSQAVQGTMLEDCMCMHGELNAILFAGFENCKGCTLYTTLYPCLLCSKSIIQSGIVRVVFQEEYNHSELSTQLLIQAGVKIDRHSSAVPMQF